MTCGKNCCDVKWLTICISLQLTRKNLMAKNMKRLKKQIEREFGKLEAAKYPWTEMSSTANIIPSLSNCTSKYIIKSCYAANATVIISSTINLTDISNIWFYNHGSWLLQSWSEMQLPVIGQWLSKIAFV